jgi:hypothetical protein
MGQMPAAQEPAAQDVLVLPQKQDLELLFKDAGITSDQPNDDALGRALEKLVRLDKKELMSAVSLELLVEHGLAINSLHLDTTAVRCELKDLAFAKDEWRDLGQISTSNPKQAAS